jgi:branched-chain amino acid aminotransferase
VADKAVGVRIPPGAPAASRLIFRAALDANGVVMTWGQGKIWYDGEMVEWADATCHVLSHVVHYGSSVFEGIRCYDVRGRASVMRLREHVRRLFDSAKIYRMQAPFSPEEIEKAILDTVRVNGLKSCYVRPVFFRGMKALGLDPRRCPVHGVVAAWFWGAYLGEESVEAGASVAVSSWRRPAADTFPSMAKAGGNYMNSQLMKMEALENGYDEAIALDCAGYVSEGSGENIFVVRDGTIYTPPPSSSILVGITRDSVLKLAQDRGIAVREQTIPREALMVADEIFFSGTAAEIVPVTRVDLAPVGGGKRGPITEAIQSDFARLVTGEAPDIRGWLTPVDAEA